jgi:hypothetical protein
MVRFGRDDIQQGPFEESHARAGLHSSPADLRAGNGAALPKSLECESNLEVLWGFKTDRRKGDRKRMVKLFQRKPRCAKVPLTKRFISS